IRARIEIREDDETLVATIAGGELGLVIGKHGQTIDAIQYLVNAIVWRGQGDDRKQVVIDAAGYRARREAALASLAVRSAARAAQRTGGRGAGRGGAGGRVGSRGREGARLAARGGRVVPAAGGARRRSDPLRRSERRARAGRAGCGAARRGARRIPSRPARP